MGVQAKKPDFTGSLWARKGGYEVEMGIVVDVLRAKTKGYHFFVRTTDGQEIGIERKHENERFLYEVTIPQGSEDGQITVAGEELMVVFIPAMDPRGQVYRLIK